MSQLQQLRLPPHRLAYWGTGILSGHADDVTTTSGDITNVARNAFSGASGNTGLTTGRFTGTARVAAPTSNLSTTTGDHIIGVTTITGTVAIDAVVTTGGFISPMVRPTHQRFLPCGLI